MAKAAFQSLVPRERAKFIRTHYGFLKAVQNNLAASGIQKTTSTISRTWMGHFHNPGVQVVEELDAEYRRRCGGAAVPANGAAVVCEGVKTTGRPRSDQPEQR